MRIDQKLLIFTFSHYAVSKPFRKTYRISATRFSILLSIYYATQINPKSKGLKSRIMRLNPQVNQVYIENTLNILSTKGLIHYERTNNPHKYRLELTTESKREIESIYSIQSIGEFLDKY